MTIFQLVQRVNKILIDTGDRDMEVRLMTEILNIESALHPENGVTQIEHSVKDIAVKDGKLIFIGNELDKA